MTVVSIAPPDPKRDAAAERLARTASWPRLVLKRPRGAFEAGTVFYRVPSRTEPTRRYVVNAACFECCDYQQNGAICAHARAVRLHEAHERDIEQAFADAERRRRSEATFDHLFGGPDFD